MSGPDCTGPDIHNMACQMWRECVIRPSRRALTPAHFRLPVEPQCETERAAAAAQERTQRRCDHVVAALVETRAQVRAGARQHDTTVDRDRIGGKLHTV